MPRIDPHIDAVCVTTKAPPRLQLMLQQLLAGASRAQVIAAVEHRFLASTERVAADLDTLLLTLREAGLIEG